MSELGDILGLFGYCESYYAEQQMRVFLHEDRLTQGDWYRYTFHENQTGIDQYYHASILDHLESQARKHNLI